MRLAGAIGRMGRRAGEMVSESLAPTAEIWLAGIADSRVPGRVDRDGGDWAGLPTGIRAYRTASSVSATLPIEHNEAVPGDLTSPLSQLEKFAQDRKADTGKNIYIVSSAVGGSALFGNWVPGGSNTLTMISRSNTAIQAIQAVEPGAVVAGIYACIGTNDCGAGDASTRAAGWVDALDDTVSAIRAGIYKNGVSGANISDTLCLMIGIQPETRRVTAVNANKMERGFMRALHEIAGTRYLRCADGYCLPDGLHETHDGVNHRGAEAADVLTSTAVPTVSPASPGVVSGVTFDQPLTLSSADVYPYIAGGADAGLFKIVTVDTAPAGASAHLWTWKLVRADDGAFDFDDPEDAGGDNVYNVDIGLVGGNGVTATQPVVLTVSEPAAEIGYEWLSGTKTESNWQEAPPFVVDIKAGMNIFAVASPSGSNAAEFGGVWAITVNGTPGSAVDWTTTGGNAAILIFNAASDIEGASVVISWGPVTGLALWVSHGVVTGVDPTPLDSSLRTFSSSPSPVALPTLTKTNADDVIVGLFGLDVTFVDPDAAFAAGTAGNTFVTGSAEFWMGYRETDGAVGATYTGSTVWGFGGALVLAKA